MLLITGGEVRGLPVVTVQGGEDVAEIRDIVYDAEAGRVHGFTLNKRGFLSGRHRSVLAADRIHAIGSDAVMVLDEDSLSSSADAEAPLRDAAGDRNVIGNDVLTEGGANLGEIRDVVLLVGGTGEVVGYQMKRESGKDQYIPRSAQLAISGTALVVPDVTEEFARDDLVGLGTAVDEFRERLGQQ